MSLPIDLTGRVALVTGSSGGVGQSIVQVLRTAGATVVGADINLPTGTRDRQGLAVAMDITSPDSVRAALDEVATIAGHPDILVNNAGGASRTHGNPFHRQGIGEWERVARLNTLGTVLVASEWARRHRAGTPGVIVNIASVAGRRPTTNDPAYSAAKASVLAFTQSAALDMAPDVRVVAVCPGMVMTAFYREQHRLTADEDPAIAQLDANEFFEQKASRLIPMRRGQEPVDVAYAVAFLVSDLARNITGQALNVDGGLVMA